MKSSLARFISFIFNPIILLIFVPLFLLYKVDDDLTYALTWTAYTFFFLLAMTLFIKYMVSRGVFTNMDVSKREQRPLLFGMSMVLITFYLGGLFLLDGPRILIIITIGIMIGIILSSIINTRLKASMHVATISALIFALAIVYNGYYLLSLFLIPLVAWARLKIKRHTLPETVVGGLLGILLSLCIYGLVKTFA
ncbi:MAG: hypothetical protein H0W89_07895 [Candidatus Levybacteria bacterium]|nr:hypothetical protein [Candidatus Levybacteria bacterium]